MKVFVAMLLVYAWLVMQGVGPWFMYVMLPNKSSVKPIHQWLVQMQWYKYNR